VTDKVRFAGSRSDVAEILRSLDLYVMPSLWEGLSLAMLEAMAAGLPVIISDVGGAAEVLGDGEFGVRVPPGDVAALARAVMALVRNRRNGDWARRTGSRARALRFARTRRAPGNTLCNAAQVGHDYPQGGRHCTPAR
jgi:glycosyltransferase involved in cell wall biosynthesis